LDEAIAMARFCVRDGITHVVATPHCHRHIRLLRADVLPHVARLNQELAHAGLPLTVLPGSEVQVTDTAAYRRDFEAGLYCHLGDGRAFTLLEFNWKPEFGLVQSQVTAVRVCLARGHRWHQCLDPRRSRAVASPSRLRRSWPCASYPPHRPPPTT